ncbi:MAG: hypothetical protein R3F33_04625 [Planctomycetota bacterium]
MRFVSSLFLACGLLAGAPRASAAPQNLDFASLSQQLLDRHGRGDTKPVDFRFDTFCGRGYAHLEVGLFDMYMERSDFGDKEDTARFFRVAATLAGLQADWLDWTHPSEKAPHPQATVARHLANYLHTAQFGPIVEAASRPMTPGGAEDKPDDGPLDLWTILTVESADLDQYRALAEFMQTDGGLQLGRKAAPEHLILVPDRARFVQYIALAGWALDHSRDQFWNMGVLTWTNFYFNDWRILATKFSNPNPSATNYQKGTQMDGKVSNGLEQQFCQLAALGLIDNYFGGNVPPTVAGGLSINLVVQQFDECNTRVDGDLRERRKEAREQFVPGGLSEGGVLPANLADSRWRDKQGKDHFLNALKDSQKNGRDAVSRKDRVDKVRYFQIKNDEETASMVTAAPVLGPQGSALGKLPADYLGDRLEFARSYSSGFLYWLRNYAVGKKPIEAQQRFADLLRTLANTKVADGGGILEEAPKPVFEAIFQQHYGLPLSDGELKANSSLEGAFLNWLPKGR